MGDPLDDQQRRSDLYFSAVLNGWFNTRIERDKSLLGLASGGIGLLLSLRPTASSVSNYDILLYILALLCFLITIILALLVLSKNAQYLGIILSGYDASIERKKEVVNEQKDLDKKLTNLDNFMIWSFGLAVVFSILTGVISITKSTEGDNTMAKSVSKNTSSKVSTPDTKKSFGGAAAFNPNNTTPSTQTLPPPSPASSSESSTTSSNSNSTTGSSSTSK